MDIYRISYSVGIDYRTANWGWYSPNLEDVLEVLYMEGELEKQYYDIAISTRSEISKANEIVSEKPIRSMEEVIQYLYRMKLINYIDTTYQEYIKLFPPKGITLYNIEGKQPTLFGRDCKIIDWATEVTKPICEEYGINVIDITEEEYIKQFPIPTTIYATITKNRESELFFYENWKIVDDLLPEDYDYLADNLQIKVEWITFEEYSKKFSRDGIDYNCI